MTGLDVLRSAVRSIPSRRVGASLAVVLGLSIVVALPSTALGAEPPRASLAADAFDRERTQPNARPEPTPPSNKEPKPKKRPKPGPWVDLEPEQPGPGERITSPVALDLFKAAGFRYQDTNWYACTATSAMDMLNFIRLGGQGGTGFRWTARLDASVRDSILAWERTHDTLAGGNGSDPHGWRNALNYYGWGSAALNAGSRVYEDYAYSTYERAVKAAVRAMIRYRKPVGIAAWRGTHAQMLTGYDGLVGYPFAVDAAGNYTNDFTIVAVRLTDPLKASAVVDKRVAYTNLRSTNNTRVRFQPYYETDSPYDDPYSAGSVRARDEWFGRWVIVAPKR